MTLYHASYHENKRLLKIGKTVNAPNFGPVGFSHLLIAFQARFPEFINNPINDM